MSIARKQLEKILGIKPVRPKLGKGETECSIFLQESDFELREKGESIFKRLCEEYNEEGELEAVITGHAQRFRHATREDPPEGGYSEDVRIWVGGEDVSDYLSQAATTKCEETQSRRVVKHYR